MTPETIGERITHARELRGMSQSDLARASEIAATQLSRYETGRATPRKLAVHRLAQALAINWRWLDAGEGKFEEYPDSSAQGLSIWIDGEMAGRLAAYAHYSGVSLAEAVADIFDFPLSVFGVEDLPKTHEEQEKLRKMLRAKAYDGRRLKVLASKVRVLPGDIGKPVSSEPRGDILKDYYETIVRMRPVQEPALPSPAKKHGPQRSPNARKPKP